MKRRIFVAIGITKKLQEEIIEWEKDYADLPVRWLAGKNLHVTLVPPWYEEDVEGVKAKLETVRGVPAFDIEFRKVSYGPDPRRPRLIWAEGEAPKELPELKSHLENALVGEPAAREGEPRLGAPRREKRPFRLHMTIARFRPENFPSFPIKKLDEEVAWRDRVNSFVLMEAHLSRGGADYEVLKEIML